MMSPTSMASQQQQQQQRCAGLASSSGASSLHRRRVALPLQRATRLLTTTMTNARSQSSSSAEPQCSGRPAAEPPRAPAAVDATTLPLTLLLCAAAAAPPALADVAAAAAATSSSPFNSQVTSQSLYVTLALFLMSVPGIWSQVKRAPVSKRVRKTFEVPGPAVAGAESLDARARAVFSYFKRYNYSVVGRGEVITFEGVYAADRGQAAAVTFYTFCGMASVALVLSILVPSVGNAWYGLTALSPLAALYYFSRGERVEQVRVKMTTSDDDSVTDIVVEGDQEEVERLRKELDLMEKGKVYVKGLLE